MFLHGHVRPAKEDSAVGDDLHAAGHNDNVQVIGYSSDHAACVMIAAANACTLYMWVTKKSLDVHNRISCIFCSGTPMAKARSLANFVPEYGQLGTQLILWHNAEDLHDESAVHRSSATVGTWTGLLSKEVGLCPHYQSATGKLT